METKRSKTRLAGVWKMEETLKVREEKKTMLWRTKAALMYVGGQTSGISSKEAETPVLGHAAVRSHPLVASSSP